MVMKVVYDRWWNCGTRTCLPWSLQNYVSGEASKGRREYEDAPLLDLYSMMVDGGRCNTTRILSLFYATSPTRQKLVRRGTNELRKLTGYARAASVHPHGSRR